MLRLPKISGLRIDGRRFGFVVQCVGSLAGWDLCQDVVAADNNIMVLTVINGIFRWYALH